MTSPSVHRRDPLTTICRLWGLSRATLHRRRIREAAYDRHPLRRRGPQGAASDAYLLAAIREVIETSPFTGEGYRKILARLRFRRRSISSGRGSGSNSSLFSWHHPTSRRPEAAHSCPLWPIHIGCVWHLRSRGRPIVSFRVPRLSFLSPRPRGQRCLKNSTPRPALPTARRPRAPSKRPALA